MRFEPSQPRAHKWRVRFNGKRVGDQHGDLQEGVEIDVEWHSRFPADDMTVANKLAENWAHVSDLEVLSYRVQDVDLQPSSREAEGIERLQKFIDAGNDELLEADADDE